MKANHKKDYKQIVGFQEITLQPGDFIFGRKSAADETGLSEQNIRTCLNFLKKTKNLTIKSTNKFSIITVVKWEDYQYSEEENNQQPNKQLTSIQPAGNHKQEQLNNLTKEKEKLFEQFWNLYDFKKSRKKCFAKWMKLKQTDIKLIFKNLPVYIQNTITDESQNKTGGFIPMRKHPITYLNNESWHDEVIQPQGSPQKQIKTPTMEEALS